MRCTHLKVTAKNIRHVELGFTHPRGEELRHQLMVDNRLDVFQPGRHRVPVHGTHLLSNIRERRMVKNVHHRRGHVVDHAALFAVQLPRLDVLHLLRIELHNLCSHRLLEDQGAAHIVRASLPRIKPHL